MALAAITLTIMATIAVGCTSKLDTSGAFGGHDYVDLGLPSGTLWATRNVGADKPQEFGDYFSWGETQPKEIYNWDNYKHCKVDGGRTLIKYYATDNLTELQPEDDAAVANWGTNWCIPSYDQWKELEENTDATWTKFNGARGYLVTGPNGNSLFLPAARCRWQEDYEGFGDYGIYWSTSLYTGYNWDAWTFTFDSDEFNVKHDYRGDGRSVRAVVRR